MTAPLAFYSKDVRALGSCRGSQELSPTYGYSVLQGFLNPEGLS